MVDSFSYFRSEPGAGDRVLGAARARRPLELASLAASLVAFVATACPPAGFAAGAEALPQDRAISLEELMAGFAAMPGLTARFREEKHLSLLREPLIGHGAIYFSPPDRFARVMHDPVASRVVVDGERLGFVGDDGSGSIAVDSHPMVGVFVDSLRKILAGDLEALRAVYRIDYLSGGPPTPGAWSARLEPVDPALREWLAELLLSGQGLSVGEFVVVERNGDTTRMTFSDVDTRHTFDEEERALLFDLPER